MNIYSANLNNIIGNGTLFHINSDKVQEKVNQSKSKENIYQQQIDEANANRNVRVERIMAKFYAGKKLSSEDLSYLAKNATENYEEIKEAIRERKILEHQMEEADSTLDAAVAYTNTLTSAKNLADSEKGKRNPWIVMGTVGQFANAYDKFVVSIEYKEKETEEAKAKEIQNDVKEKKELLEQEIEQIKNMIKSQKEKQDKGQEQALNQISQKNNVENSDFLGDKLNQEQKLLTEKNEDIIKILEEKREGREKNKKHRKSKNRQSINNFSIGLKKIIASMEKQIQFQKQMSALYSNKGTKIKCTNVISENTNNKANIIDIEV